jgi:hypothetical protein
MGKIVRLTESELKRIIKNIISESDINGQQTSNNVVPCSQLGVKSPGMCESHSKFPVMPCAKLGIKSIGYCYVDTKQPISIPRVPKANPSKAPKSAGDQYYNGLTLNDM